MDQIYVVQSQTQLAVSISFYISCLVLFVSLNGKPFTLHETNYYYKAYLEKPYTMVLSRLGHI
jgi:hypothetical protein